MTSSFADRTGLLRKWPTPSRLSGKPAIFSWYPTEPSDFWGSKSLNVLVSQRTRPDISYVASLVGFLATRAPRRAVQISEKTMAYLQRPETHGLLYQADGSGLVAYCDASFAPDGGRSHSGWIVLLHGCVIAWRSGRQSTLTLSSAESEHMAMSEAVLALQCTEAMLHDMFPGGHQMQLFSDSTAALAIANGSGSWRTRHLRLRSAWLAELISMRAITVQHCIGELQPADLLTKALSSQRIKTLNGLLNSIWWTLRMRPRSRSIM